MPQRVVVATGCAVHSTLSVAQSCRRDLGRVAGGGQPAKRGGGAIVVKQQGVKQQGLDNGQAPL